MSAPTLSPPQADCIQLEIVTPAGPVLKQLTGGFTLPTALGRIGVLRNHAPLVAVVEPGPLYYQQQGRSVRVELGKGFLELHQNQAVILVDQAKLIAPEKR